MAMSQTDIDRVKTAFDAVKADVGNRVKTSLVGGAGGVAPLDADGLVPASLLPAGIGGGNTTRVVYTGSSWPPRPSATTYVEWVDPTGTAPAPSAAVSGDTVVIGTGVAGARPVELLSIGDQALTSTNWWQSVATATIDTTAGTITLSSGARAARGDVAVTPGATLTLALTAAAGNTGTFEGWCDFFNASNGYISSGVGTGVGAGVRTGTGVVPAGAHHVSVFLAGASGPAVIDTVSLKQAV